MAGTYLRFTMIPRASFQAVSLSRTKSAFGHTRVRLSNRSQPPFTMTRTNRSQRYALLLQDEEGSDECTLDELKDGMLPPSHRAKVSRAALIIAIQAVLNLGFILVILIL